MKQQEQKDQEFDFIKEKIKEKPINKRRLFFQMGFNLFCAVIFGVVACLVFVLLRPYMEAWINPKEESAISIPRDDLESEGEKQEGENPQGQRLTRSQRRGRRRKIRQREASQKTQRIRRAAQRGAIWQGNPRSWKTTLGERRRGSKIRIQFFRQKRQKWYRKSWA